MGALVRRNAHVVPFEERLPDLEVASILDEEGKGKFFEFSYDPNTEERYGMIRTTAGVVDEKWFHADGQLKQWTRNGKLIRKVDKVVREIEEKDDRVYVFTYLFAITGPNGTIAVIFTYKIPYPPTIWNALTLEITDGRGKKWREEYDRYGNLVEVTNPDETKRSFEYDLATNLLIRQTNENGVASEFGYDAHRNLVRIDEAVGTPVARRIQMTYDAADRLLADGRKRVALLGTRFTMTEPYVRERLEARGIELAPIGAAWVQEVDRIIYDELAAGRVVRDSQRKLKSLITELSKQKVQAIVLGCTELVLAVDTKANVLPVYDTTAIHARYAVDWMLSEEEAARAAA